MIDGTDYNATAEEQAQLDKIYETYNNGGPFAHNLIGMTLSHIAKTNEPLAEAIHADLQEQGY